MPSRVYTGCRDCKNCMNSDLAHTGRKLGRASASVVTLGASELAMATRKKCRACGHQLSLHAQFVEAVYAPSAYGAPAPSAPAPTNPAPGTDHPGASQPGFLNRTYRRIHTFYTHPDRDTRSKRRLGTAIALVVFGVIGSIGNFADGELGAGLQGWHWQSAVRSGRYGRWRQPSGSGTRRSSAGRRSNTTRPTRTGSCTASISLRT